MNFDLPSIPESFSGSPVEDEKRLAAERKAERERIRAIKRSRHLQHKLDNKF